MKRDDIIGGALLLIAIIAIGLFFVFAKSAPELAYGPVEITGSAITASAKVNGEIDVTATLMQPGFVTIHQSIGSAPGPIIGESGYLMAGVDVDTTIILSELMTPGLTYIALLHVDNGDETFVVIDDMPVTSEGKSVRADFNYQTGP